MLALLRRTSSSRLARRAAIGIVAAAMTTAAACGGGGDGGGTTTTPTPTIGVTLSSATSSVQAGASGAVTITVSRGGGYAGAVDLSLEGAPAGVTGTFAPASVGSGATSSTLTLATTAAATAGTYNLTVRAKGSNVTDATSALALTVTAPPAQGIGVTVAPATLSVAQGGSGTSTVTLARTNGFAGAIDLTAEGAPAGVTATFAPASVAAGATTSTVTVAVGAAVAPGSYTVTVRGKGTGAADGTAALALTVTAAPAGSFTLTLAPTAATVQAGQQGTATVTVARQNGFAGAVALSATAPAGVTVTFNPASVTGTTSTATIAVGAGVAAGSYTVAIKGTGTGVTDQTANVALTVTAAPTGGGNVTWSFCQQTAPLWVAVQDGTGPWTAVAANANGTYSFTINAAKGGVAYVQQQSGGGFQTTVFYGTKAELTGRGTTVCASTTGLLKTVNGSVAGLGGPLESSVIAMGGTATGATSINPSFTLTGVPDGPRDLIASRVATTVNGGAVSQIVNKLIIRRNLNPANGSTLPVLDFNAAEAFAPVQRNVTINGLNGEMPTVSMLYLTANGAAASIFADVSQSAAATRAFYGVPAANQAAGDLHGLFVSSTTINGTTIDRNRSVLVYFKDIADKTVTLGPTPNAPTITTLATSPYARLRAQWTAQAEYNQYFFVNYSQGNGASYRSVSISASAGWVGGSAVDLPVPDFTGLAGFQATWLLQAGVQTMWLTSGSTASFDAGPSGALGIEGGIVTSGQRGGTITP